MLKQLLLRRAIFIAPLMILWHAILFAQTTFTWNGATAGWNTANWVKTGTVTTAAYPNANAGENHIVIINAGTVSINASFISNSITSVIVSSPGVVSLTAVNTIAISGNLTGTGTLTQSAGTVNVSGDVTLSNLTLSGGTFGYTGIAGTQIVKSTTYFTFNKSGAGTATLAGNVIAAATTVSAGTLDLGASNNFTATTLTGAGAVTIGSGNLSLSGNNSHSGTFTPGTGTVTYTGGAQTIRSTTYNNLTFTSAGTKTASAATLTVGGTFTFTNSTLAMAGNALILQGAVLGTAGNITSTGSVNYNSSSNQDVIPGTAGTFIKNGSGIATLFGNITCSAGITLTAGSLDLSTFNLSGTTMAGAGTLTAGSGTITLTGSNTHSGAFNAGTSTVVYNINSAQTIQGYAPTGYYNLTISNSNTKTLANALTVSNQFTYNGSGSLSIGNNACSFHHFGQSNGTITFGTAALSFSGNVHKTGGTYTAGSGAVSFSGTGFVSSNAAITISTGAATINGNRTIQGAGAITISNVNVVGTLSNKINLIVNTALSGAGTFSNDSTASLLDVNFTGAGPTVSSFNVSTNGIVRYSAAGAQTTRAVVYFNLSTSTSGIKTISVGSSIGNNLSVGSQTDCAFNITIPGNLSGTALFNLTGNSTLSVNGNFTSTGGLTITGNGAFNANGNVTHGGGNLSFNSSAVVIVGILNGTGNVSLSGTGSLNFTGGGWTSTTGTFTPGGTTTTYSGTSGSQTVRSTTYANLSLTGAALKNYGTGATGAVSGVFNNPVGQKLIFPVSAATLALNGTVTGTGELLGDPAGTLIVGAAGATTSLGTLYFDTTKAIGTINFNREWNRAIQVTIGSSVRLNAYTFAGPTSVGSIIIADGEVFKLESNTVTAASTLPANIGRLRFIMLGTGSKFVFEPNVAIPASTNLTFPIGPLPTASTQYDVLLGNANGTLNAAIIGATTINGTGTNFDDQIQVGYNLTLSNGTIVGEIASYVSATQITLKAPGALVVVPVGSTFRLIQAYRPVTIIPSLVVAGGSLEIGLINHSGGGVTSGTNVPNVPSNRRTNYIYQIRATGGFPTSAIWTESLLSNDFNATIDDAKYSFFRWNGSFWIKLAADLVGPGLVPSNTQIRRNSITTMPGVQTFLLGQTGGVLPDDPTFSWTGAGGNNFWKNAGNWNVFPTGAGPWPDDIGHNVIIDGGGTGNPILQTGDSVNVKNISHFAKQLTIKNNGVLNIVGNYSFNQPNLTSAGIGRLIQTGFSVVGTNGSQFLTQLVRGSLLYTTEGGFIGSVQAITTNAALTLNGIGGGTPVNIPDSSTFNIIVPTISSSGANLSANTGNKIVTGTGFTSALNGRALYIGANLLVGFVSQVQSGTSLLLVNNSLQTTSNTPYLVSSLIVPNGTATTNFESGSKVNYNNSNADQTIAATSYANLTMMDSRVGAATDIIRYVNCPGQTITIRGRYRGRSHVKPAASLGTTWQFQNGSRMSLIFPSGSNTATAGVWTNFPIAGVVNAYNIKWGTLPTDLVSYDGFLGNNNNMDFPAMDATIGSRFGDFSLVNTGANSRWNLTPGMSFTVNGAFSLTNTSGATNDVINFGNNTINPAVNLTLLGTISGLNNIRNSGAPVHLGNITIGGTGTISGDLFENISQIRNLTINRPIVSLNLTAALNLTATEKITITNGNFGHTGTGTITSGSAAASGIDITGGTLAMSSSSNLALISSGGLTLSAGTVNLNNTGSVSIAGNFTQTGGIFNRPTNPTTLQGNVSATSGTTNFSGATVSLTGSNAQGITVPATGLDLTNLTINKTGGDVTISSGKLKVTGSVNMPVTNSANLVTTVSGNLTLVSNASGTARIGAVLGGSLAGSNFTMQRYIGGSTLGWYFMGTPVTGQTLGNWSDNFSITTPLSCSGTFTGTIDRNTVFRFAGDAVPVDGPTAYEANGWRSPASCSINPGEGYRTYLKAIFFSSGSTFDNTGGMNFGNTPLNVTFNATGYDGGGWNLVSNPFPSNIDWDAATGWTKTNMQNALYIWNGATSQYGSYVAGFGINNVDNIIPSSQAFLVRANASPVLSVNENAKTATSKNFLRVAVNTSALRIKLKKNDKSDETIIHFADGASDEFDSNLDAAKIENEGLSLASISNNSKYGINGIAVVETEKVISLSVKTSELGTFVLDISGIESGQTSHEVYLRDNYLGQLNQLTEDLVMNFEVSADPASSGDNRFELIFVNPNVVTTVKTSASQIFSLFPNPSKGGKITLKTGKSAGLLTVSDLLGRVVKTQSISSSDFETQFDGPTTPGVYQVRFEGANGAKFNTKLVVK